MTGQDSSSIKLVGFLLIIVSLTWLVSIITSIIGIILIGILGLVLFIWGFKTPVKKSGMIFAGLLMMIAAIGLLLFDPIVQVIRAINEIFSINYFYPIFVFICGLILIVKGTWGYRFLGFILFFTIFMDATSGVVEIFTSKGITNPGYFFFAVGVVSGLILLFKAPGASAKISGIMLMVLTFPIFAEVIDSGIPFSLLGMGLGTVALFIFCFFSAILLLTKIRYLESNSMRTLSVLLAVLLVALALPWASGPIISFISIIASIPDGFSSPGFTQYATSLVIGIICLIGGKKSIDYAKTGYSGAASAASKVKPFRRLMRMKGKGLNIGRGTSSSTPPSSSSGSIPPGVKSNKGYRKTY